MTDQEPPALILDFDCLLEIFSYLDLEDLLSVSQVCLKWEWASKSIWESLKKLDLHRPGNFRFERDIIGKRPALKQLLELCPNVNEINMHVDHHDIMRTIAESCPQLRILVLNHNCERRCWTQCKFSLTKTCHELESVTFTVIGTNCSLNVLGKLFSRAPHLRELAVSGSISGNGRWIKTINKPLKLLGLLTDFHPRFLIFFLEKFGRHLKHLYLCPPRMWNGKVHMDVDKFVKIFSLTPNLVALDMVSVWDIDYNEENGPLGFKPLSELGRLRIQYFRATSGLFFEHMIARCPNLCYLSVSPSKYAITYQDHPFLSLHGHQRPRNTHWTSADRFFSPRVISMMRSLQHLFLFMADIDDERCLEILNQCHLLRRLDLSFNERLTNSSFDAACDVVARDPSRQLSVVFIGCPNITKTAVGLDPRFSRISFIFGFKEYYKFLLKP